MAGSKTSYAIPVLLIGLLFVALNARASSLTLTTQGSASGFSISTFATGFANNGAAGPFGIGVAADGHVYVSDPVGGPSSIYVFSTDADGQTAASATMAPCAGSGYCYGLTTVGNTAYVAMYFGPVYSLHTDGTVNGTIAGVGGLGLATNPTNGHLVLASSSGLVDIDPGTGITRMIAAGVYSDGVSVSPDGKTVYTSSGTGYNYLTGALVFTPLSTGCNGADGTAVGTGTLAGNLFMNCNDGTVVEINLSTGNPTVIATGGTRGDFVGVDGTNGSLLLSQSNDIMRLTAPSGGGFGAPPSVPEPSSLFLLGSGLVGLIGTLRRRLLR